jgi:transposase InsO family protein
MQVKQAFEGYQEDVGCDVDKCGFECDENHFEKMLPEYMDPYTMPELSEGLEEIQGPLTMQNTDGAIPIFVKGKVYLEPRSQMVVPFIWAASPERNTEYVITPCAATVFGAQLMGAYCLVNSEQENPHYAVINMREKGVWLKGHIPLGYAVASDTERTTHPVEIKGKPLTVPLTKMPSRARHLLMVLEEDYTDEQAEELLRWSEQQERPSKSGRLGTDPSRTQPKCTLSEEQKKECERYRILEPTMTSEQKLKLLAVLKKHTELFAKTEYDMGNCTLGEHHIDTGDAVPIACNPHRLPVHQREMLREELNDLLKSDVIEESTSPWAAPCLYVPKKDGSYRLCMDFRRLNAVIRPYVYPLPRIDDIFDTLEGAQYFTAIDLAKGFWQISLDEESRQKAAFTTIYGQYQYRRLPFGLQSAPSAFQKVMNTVLAGLNWVQCMVYLDDILIFSETFEKHLATIDDVFVRLDKAGLKIKLKKCEWARSELRYLGHVINSKGKMPDPGKVSAIKEMPTPRCVKDIESFLGKVGYYHKFIQGFSHLAQPLNRLKKKNAVWEWGPEQQKSFETLRDRLCEMPVLRHPDFSRPFVLQTDASGYGLGAVLSQVLEDGEHPIAYASRTLEDRETRHAVIEKEALAILWGVHHFRHYLLGKKFLIQTDHKPLVYLQQIKDQNVRLQKIALKLQGYQFTIEHRPGVKNQNADHLSRYPVVPLKDKFGNPKPAGKGEPNKDTLKTIQTNYLLAVEYSTQPLTAQQAAGKWQDLLTGQRYDQWFGPVIRYLEREQLPDSILLARQIEKHHDSYLLDDDKLFRVSNTKIQLCIPIALRELVMRQCHDVPTAGHLGFKKTYQRVQSHYYWPSMHRDLKLYVESCAECSVHKAPPRKFREKLGEPIRPKGVWKTLHMDVWTPGKSTEPTPHGNVCVLALVDSFSKYVFAVPLPNHTAKTIVDVLVNRVFPTYGIPQKIVSDNATEFSGLLMERMYKFSGITRKLTTPHNPKANGQVERYFRSMRAMLAAVATRDRQNWDTYVAHCAYAYNTSIHRSIHNTPYFLMYGRDPELLLQDGVAPVEDPEDPTSEWYLRLKRVRKLVEGFILEHALSNKEAYDRVCRPQEFLVGDAVLLYRDRPTNTHGPRKLMPRYTGPFRVEQVIGKTVRIRPIRGPDQVNAKETSATFDQIKHVDEDRVLLVPEEHRTDPAEIDPNLDEEEDDDLLPMMPPRA